MLLISAAILIWHRGVLIPKRPKHSSGESVDYVRSSMSECSKVGDRVEQQRCFRNLAKTLLSKFSFGETVQALTKVQDQYDCHSLMHYVVNQEYRRGTSLPEIYEQCTNTCFGACYHGGIEGYFVKNNLQGANQETLEKAALAICDSVPPKFGNLRNECHHGLGHALMLVTDADLMRSLRLCDSLPEGKSNCYDGVFMENLPLSTTNADHPSRFIKTSDPLYPCDVLAQRYLSNCYSFQSGYFRYLVNGDVLGIVRLCARVPNLYQASCFSNIGSSAQGTVPDLVKAKSTCELLPPGLPRESCIRGVVLSFGDRYGHDHARMFKMFDFCPMLSENYKRTCYIELAMMLDTFVPDAQERSEACARVGDIGYKNICLNKSRSLEL